MDDYDKLTYSRAFSAGLTLYLAVSSVSFAILDSTGAGSGTYWGDLVDFLVFALPITSGVSLFKYIKDTAKQRKLLELYVK